MAGLEVADRPSPGRVAIIDATGTAASSWDIHEAEPWLLIWLGAADGVRETRVRGVDTVGVWSIVRSRVVVAPEVGARAAIEACGRPGLALALVEHWTRNPGFRSTAEGLSWLRAPRRDPEAAAEWWAQAVTGWTREKRAAACQLAVLPPPFDGQVGRALLGDTGAALRLRGIGTPCNDTWLMPAALRHVLLHDATAGELARLHAAAGRAESDGDLKSFHALASRPDRSRTEVMLRAVANRPSLGWNEGLEGPIQTAAARHLLSPGITHALAGVRHHRPEHLRHSLMHGARADQVVAAVALVLAGQQTSELHRWIMEHRHELPQPEPAGLLLRDLAFALAGRQQRSTALAVLDEVHPVTALQHELDRWFRAKCVAPERQLARLETLVDRLEHPAVVRLIHVDIADGLLAHRAHADAMEHLDHARGVVSYAADYNRMVCLLGLQRHEEAKLVAGDLAAWTFARGRGDGALARGAIAVLLGGHLHAPDAQWRAIEALSGPVHDPHLAEELRRWMTCSPTHTRREVVRDLLVDTRQ